MNSLSLSQSDLDALVREEVGRRLDALLPALAEKHIADRCARLTLEEAAQHLRCANRAQLMDCLRRRRIPVLRESRKKAYILLADLLAADRRDSAALAQPTVLTRAA